MLIPKIRHMLKGKDRLLKLPSKKNLNQPLTIETTFLLIRMKIQKFNITIKLLNSSIINRHLHSNNMLNQLLNSNSTLNKTLISISTLNKTLISINTLNQKLKSKRSL